VISKQGGRKRILIAEDDAAVLDILHRILSREYDVITAHTGLEALQILDTPPLPDLLIVDIMMPQLDGLSLVKAIKKRGQTKGIPVIIVTARTDPKSIIEGINVGARHYITKPFKIEQVMEKVRKILL
jgi:DNA-binding response OmpR family regulator